MSLTDTLGRPLTSLRLSVTDRCNLRCAYCMPEEPVWFPREALLTFEELARVARVAVGTGVRKVRITGGEPLVRRDLPRLVERLAAIPGLDGLSLTTNGVLLAEQARDLAAAGPLRLNVSLDTLDREQFARMTGRDRLVPVGDMPKGLNFTVRFHIHPDIRTSRLEGGGILLKLPGGEGWRFRAGGGVLEVEESVYLGGPVVRRAEQLVISGSTKNAPAEIAWVFEQIVA